MVVSALQAASLTYPDRQTMHYAAENCKNWKLASKHYILYILVKE